MCILFVVRAIRITCAYVYCNPSIALSITLRIGLGEWTHRNPLDGPSYPTWDNKMIGQTLRIGLGEWTHRNPWDDPCYST